MKPFNLFAATCFSCSRPILLTLAILLNPQLLQAKNNAHEHHYHDAHIHGEAELQLALEGERLLVSFHSPAINLLGFEHPPQGLRQQHALSHAGHQLNAHSERYTLLGGACSIIEKLVELPYAATLDHHDGKATPEDHGEFTANYQYHCQRPKKLAGIETDLFSVFPGIRKIRVSWVFPGGQGATVLTAEHSRLEIN